MCFRSIPDYNFQNFDVCQIFQKRDRFANRTELFKKRTNFRRVSNLSDSGAVAVLAEVGMGWSGIRMAEWWHAECGMGSWRSRGSGWRGGGWVKPKLKATKCGLEEHRAGGGSGRWIGLGWGWGSLPHPHPPVRPPPQTIPKIDQSEPI